MRNSAEFNEVASEVEEFAREQEKLYGLMLEDRFYDLPPDWDMYEGMADLQRQFRRGVSANQIFLQRYGDL